MFNYWSWAVGAQSLCSGILSARFLFSHSKLYLHRPLLKLTDCPSIILTISHMTLCFCFRLRGCAGRAAGDRRDCDRWTFGASQSAVLSAPQWTLDTGPAPHRTAPHRTDPTRPDPTRPDPTRPPPLAHTRGAPPAYNTHTQERGRASDHGHTSGPVTGCTSRRACACASDPPPTQTDGRPTCHHRARLRLVRPTARPP